MTSNNSKLPPIAEQIIVEEKTTQQTQTETQAQDINWFERKIEEQNKKITELEMLNNRQENKIKKQKEDLDKIGDENTKLYSLASKLVGQLEYIHNNYPEISQGGTIVIEKAEQSETNNKQKGKEENNN